MKTLENKILLGLLLMPLIACSDDDSSKSDELDTTEETVTELHEAFAEFDSDRVEITISQDGADYVITSNGRPNHQTKYYPVDNELYLFEEGPHTGGDRNGDGEQTEDEKTRIQDDGDYEVTITVDATPNFSSLSIETEVNTIGIAVSGGYIFNQLEGPVVLDAETADNLDYTGAHIGPSVYHYHLEPHAFSSDDSNLIGILIDGVFIYGRKCTSTGTYPEDLDEVGGHTHVTEHSSGEEEYHYHMKNEPFLVSVDGDDEYLIFEGPYQGF